MTITINSTIPLERFIHDASWTPVLGTYLYPLRHFGRKKEPAVDPNDYLEVVHVIHFSGRDVAVTRGGGLFVRQHGPRREMSDVHEIVSLFNLILCEFAFDGVVSDPVTDTDVHMGKLIDRHAAIAGGFGSYGHRTWAPLALLMSAIGEGGWWAPNFYWTALPFETLTSITGTPRAQTLQQCSPELPGLLVAAASHAERHNGPETVVTSWVVCESILSFKWDQYLETVTEPGRKKRLEDNRVYTASVQAEFLFGLGLLPAETYSILQEARKIRNDLVHNVKLSPMGSFRAFLALREAVRWLGISPEKLPNSYGLQGSIGGPATALEPTFPFA